MVYCKLINVNKDAAKYSFGGRIDDITGILVYHRKEETCEIEKEPDNSIVYGPHIRSLMCKYVEEFRSGKFRAKIGYEF